MILKLPLYLLKSYLKNNVLIKYLITHAIVLFNVLRERVKYQEFQTFPPLKTTRVIVKGRVERTRKIQHGREKTLTVRASFLRAQVNF